MRVDPGTYDTLPKFDMVYLWKRRSVFSPTAPQTDREEHLYVLWNKPPDGPAHPTKSMMDDPILSSIWIMKTGMCYAVGSSDKGFFGPHVRNVVIFYEKKSALEEYKRRVKTLRRSKETDYGEPLYEDECGGEATETEVKP